MSKLRRIKKYKNRLMYDTATSKLITLKQLAEMLRENCNVRIEDKESGKDITRMTILQMLIDLEKSGKGMRNLMPDLVAFSRCSRNWSRKTNATGSLDGPGPNS